MSERLPKFHETFIPILKILSDGKTIHYNELRKKVQSEFYSNLPEGLLQIKTKAGDPLILNRIGWGKAYLKQAKMVEQPERAMVRITEKGKRALEKGSLSFSQIRKDPDYQAHEAKKQVDPVEEESDNSPQDRVEIGIKQIEQDKKSELLERIKEVDPYYFEKIILILLKKMGYGDFVETKKSNDQGIDGVINQDKLGLEKIYIQAKRYTNNKVNELDIRNFIGAMSGDTMKGVFVTTSEFADKAITKAKEAHHSIILLGGIFIGLL